MSGTSTPTLFWLVSDHRMASAPDDTLTHLPQAALRTPSPASCAVAREMETGTLQEINIMTADEMSIMARIDNRMREIAGKTDGISLDLDEHRVGRQSTGCAHLRM